MPVRVPAAAVAQAHLNAVSFALRDYGQDGKPESLGQAFGSARAAVLTLGDGVAFDVAALRGLVGSAPELRALLDVAARRAQTMTGQASAELWRHLGLTGAAPAWDAAELDTARLLLALALAHPSEEVSWLAARLQAIGARRGAELLAGELQGAGDAVWERALGDRYGSVRHRYAPRTPWRSLPMRETLRGDLTARRAVAAGLADWWKAGAAPALLAGALEAALVHARCPARVA